MTDDPKLRVLFPETEAPISIPKPEDKFSLDRFKSKLDTWLWPSTGSLATWVVSRCTLSVIASGGCTVFTCRISGAGAAHGSLIVPGTNIGHRPCAAL